MVERTALLSHRVAKPLGLSWGSAWVDVGPATNSEQARQRQQYPCEV